MNDVTRYKLNQVKDGIWVDTMGTTNILDYDKHNHVLSKGQRAELNTIWGLLLEAHNRTKILARSGKGE